MGKPHWLTYVRSVDGALSIITRCTPCWMLHTLPVEHDAAITSSFRIAAAEGQEEMLWCS